GGQLIAQVPQLITHLVRIISDVSEAVTLFLHEVSLLFDRRNRVVLSILPEPRQQSLDCNSACDVDAFFIQAGYITNIEAVLIDAAKDLQLAWQRRFVRRMRRSQGGPAITHRFFKDDA